MKIEQIELILDNQESVLVDIKYIGYLKIKDIKTDIYEYGKLYNCEDFVICINNKIPNRALFGFDRNKNTYSPLNRLNNWKDISFVRLEYKNGAKKDIYIKWEDKSSDNDMENKYQHCYFNKYGDLFIVISDSNNIETYFKIKDINDKNFLDLMWEEKSIMNDSINTIKKNNNKNKEINNKIDEVIKNLNKAFNNIYNFQDLVKEEIKNSMEILKNIKTFLE